MPAFFDLPPELRDIVYHELWTSHNCVAARHEATGSNILAYYDGMALEESKFNTGQALRDVQKSWCPDKHPGLPRWLQTNKTTLKEGFDKYCLHACWNIWLGGLSDAQSAARQYTPHPDKMIMSLRHARSIVVGRIFLYSSHVPSITRIHDGVIILNHDRDKDWWYHDIAYCVGKESQLRRLKVAFALPSLPLFLTESSLSKPHERRYLVPDSVSALIKASTALERFEMELFHRKYSPDEKPFLNTEIFERLPPVVAKMIGPTFRETVTKYVGPANGGILNGEQMWGKQLLDCKMTYDRKRN